jgi:hypothetical protein
VGLKKSKRPDEKRNQKRQLLKFNVDETGKSNQLPRKMLVEMRKKVSIASRKK